MTDQIAPLTAERLAEIETDFEFADNMSGKIWAKGADEKALRKVHGYLKDVLSEVKRLRSTPVPLDDDRLREILAEELEKTGRTFGGHVVRVEIAVSAMRRVSTPCNREAVITDEMVDNAAYAFCKGDGHDPDQMTYIMDDGIQQPYGPMWMHYQDGARAALVAALKSRPTDKAKT